MDEIQLVAPKYDGEYYRNKLLEYSREIGSYSVIDITSLIESHRYLRNERIEDQEQRKKFIQKAIEEGINRRLTYNYVNIKEFFDLSLKDIIKRYYDEDE